LIVLDASAALEVLLGTPAAARIEKRMFAPGESLHAPHLIDLEIAQVLRRYEAVGEIDSSRAQQALEDLDDLPIARYPHQLFLSRIWALRKNFTAYDAAYIALAEALLAPLLTRDRRLASAPGSSASIEVIS
jgi:predicted nucleic acid-binding protein